MLIQQHSIVGVTFGELFDDEEGQQFFEAIVGTLRAAKKRGVVDFKGQVNEPTNMSNSYSCVFQPFMADNSISSSRI